ncbi:hypothetical protein PANO111632_02600 [Paracoccus nototheniae]|uniref:Uncharacterized protein n=1 Tax=Paracoccus nototheniae TaxID=2489002 RepID=A0ABW4DY12_9RHOB|nr:hypothetical protein [Paracoccus nototheniae]
MSASVIGALRVNLGLDSAQFNKGLGASQSRMSKFAARAGTVAFGLAATMKTAFVSMGLSAINAGSEIQRLAQLTNTAPAQFQGWAAGASSVGIEQEKLADILKDTNDRIGDFVQTGGGPMADFFEKIAPKVGVTAASFRDLSGADALQLYVSSLEKANVNQQDFTFYMEAMASDSTLLLPLLKNGGVAMSEYADRAQRMGAIMSGPMLSSLKEGKTALADMRMAIDGMRNTIGTLAVPAIKALAAAIGAAAIFFHTHADTIATVMRTLAGVALVLAATFATRYAVALGVTAVRAMMSAATQSIALEMALGAQSRAAAAASVATKALSGAIGMLRRAMISTGIGALVVAAGYLVGKFVELIQKTGGFGSALQALGTLAGLVWDGIGESAKAIPPALNGVWTLVKADFLLLLSSLSDLWVGFLDSILADFGKIEMLGWGEGDNKVMWSIDNPAADGLRDARDSAEAFSADLQERGAETAAAMGESFSHAGTIVKDAFAPVAAAWAALQGEVEEGVDVPPDAGTGLDNLGDAAEGAGGKAKEATEQLTELQRVMKELRAEDAKMRATMNMTEVAAKVWENQRAAGVSAGSVTGQEIEALTRQIDSMEQLKSATEDWRDTLSSSFSQLVQGAQSLGDALTSLISKFADMLLTQGFNTLWDSSGMGQMFSGAMGAVGIGANANGTRSWEGGLSKVHERGGEIMNLPRGTQVIPHDLSKRMVRAQSERETVHVTASFDAEAQPIIKSVIHSAARGAANQAVQGASRASADARYSRDGH